MQPLHFEPGASERLAEEWSSRTAFGHVLRFPLRMIAAVLLFTVATVVSLLPARWRGEFDREGRTLLAMGTAVSALLQLLIMLRALPAVCSAADAASAYLPLSLLLLVFLTLLLDPFVRFLSVMLVGEPLGTLPMWALERTVWGVRRLLGVYVDEPEDRGAQLPRARALPKRASRLLRLRRSSLVGPKAREPSA